MHPEMSVMRLPRSLSQYLLLMNVRFPETKIFPPTRDAGFFIRHQLAHLTQAFTHACLHGMRIFVLTSPGKLLANHFCAMLSCTAYPVICRRGFEFSPGKPAICDQKEPRSRSKEMSSESLNKLLFFFFFLKECLY